MPIQFVVQALNPATADNISNYALVNLGADDAPGGTGAGADTSFSQYITSATFVPGPPRQQTSDSFTGTINLTFAPGLPSGTYVLEALTPGVGTTQGITDAAGNPIAGGTFFIEFNFQPTASYITNVQAVTLDPNGGPTKLSGPKAYFEIPSPGATPRAVAPPTQFIIDLSNPMNTSLFTGPNNTATNPDIVQLIRSADTPTSAPDGDFGTDPTFQSGQGYTRVAGTTVQLVNSVLGATFGQPGFKNRLVLTIPAGTTLPADHYRLYIPNQITGAGEDLRLFDQFGNQLDGEFLGNPSPSGNGTYEDLLPTGEIRPNDLSGDGVPGGAFETGYIVVPNGNVIYARPDYVVDPNLPDTAPDGSFQKPYAALAPEATPDSINGGDLNSAANYTDPTSASFDRNGNGHFDPSAFYEASVLSAKGPVVIVALPAANSPAQTFVLQAPSGTNTTLNDGSASVPFNTDLVFTAGSILKLSNASLFVQNQGSSLQVKGGPNPSQQVIFTSYLDDSAGGDSNGDGSSSAPQGGDWGGIVFRNFNDTSTDRRPAPCPRPADPWTRYAPCSASRARTIRSRPSIRRRSAMPAARSHRPSASASTRSPTSTRAPRSPT